MTQYATILKDSKTKGRLGAFGFVNEKEQDVYRVLQWVYSGFGT